MAAQERIIGGGFLLFGVVIVLILLYIFAWSGMGSQEAHELISAEVFPAYLKAEQDGEYLEVKAHAKRILELIDAGGTTGVRKLIDRDGVGSRPEGRKLKNLLDDGAFAKNAEGLYEFRNDWYGEATHRALTLLEDCVESRMKGLRALRRVARDARHALDEARMGSKLPIVLPAAKALPEDDVPIVRPNPVYESDTELFRIFGLKAESLAAAIAVPNPGGKATSARLRWNKNIAPTNLGTSIESVPEQARALDGVANQIQSCAATLEGDSAAAEAYARLLKQGANMLGAGLEEPHKSTFRENAGKFETAGALVQVLRKEARMLEPYLGTVRTLGGSFARQFEK